MEEKDEIVVDSLPPARIEGKESLQRLGKIFFHMAIALIVISGLCLLSVLITPVLYLFAIAILFVIVVAIVVLSLGTTFLVENNPAAKVWDVLGSVMNSNVLEKVSVFCFNITKWFAVAGIALCALSIVFIAVGKGKSKKGTIIGLAVMMALFAAVLAFHLITGGAQ